MKTGVTIADYLSFRQKEMVAKIIRLRQANGLSQQELAEVLG
jgi:DNA-binding XRE family transcriptional regulator